MTEEAELQAKIAAISGKIDQYKQYPAPHAVPNQHYSTANHRGYARWTPYGRGLQMHRNRTLVINNAASQENHQQESTATPIPSKDRFVARGGHQLMSEETYHREQAKKQEYRDKKRAAKRQKLDTTPARELEVEGIRFRVEQNGGKLIRVSGNDAQSATATQETPKTATVAGVVFVRTKHGNLIREDQKARYICDHWTLNERGSLPTFSRRTMQHSAKEQCAHFTKHGQCPFGPRCKFAHNPNQVAICKDFLRSGSCPNGETCDMSHEMTYHRVPACTYFIRGNCTNSACRYPHVHVSPAASVCRPFATLGFCAKGPECDKRHVFECPDYANRGFCPNRTNGKCLLPHPDRAGVMRKVAERQARLASGEESDVSSDEEKIIIDVDSDIAEELTGSDEDSHELTQQQDFVAFS